MPIDKKNIIKISMSFSDKDYGYVKEVATKLVENGIQIVSDSRLLVGDAEHWGLHKFDVYDSLFQASVSYCIVFLSENYCRDKLSDKAYKCKFIENVVARNGFVLPVTINSSNCELPGVTRMLGKLDLNNENADDLVSIFFKKINYNRKSLLENEKYIDIERVISLYNEKRSVYLVEQYSKKDAGIGFELYETVDNLLGDKIYFIYLYNDILYGKTFTYIKLHHTSSTTKNKLIVLIQKNRNHVSLDTRKNNVSKLFDINTVFYIDEFIWQQSTYDAFDQEIYEFPIGFFVDSKVVHNSEQSALAYLMNWHAEFNNPILVIKGNGGIGKTTLVKKFSNELQKIIENTKILFADAHEIVADIATNNDMIADGFDLYEFYKIYFEKKVRKFTNCRILSKDVFKLNVDNGNIIIIIDGFDEVIANLTNFNLRGFLVSIKNYTSEAKNGKVILTCRNYFWDKDEPGIELDEIELKPFDTSLATLFFEKNYPNFPRLVSQGMEIARTLMGKGAVDEYSPYVLDIASYILKEKVENLDSWSDPSIETGSININIDNDYLLYKICHREYIKYPRGLTPNQQISIFVDFSVHYNASIKRSDLGTLVGGCLSRLIPNRLAHIDQITHNMIESFSGHPLLKYNHHDDRLFFKYDFFEEHFQNIYLGYYLSNTISEMECLKPLELIAKKAKFRSIFAESLCTRFKGGYDDFVLWVLEKMDYLRELCNNNIKNDLFVKCCSAFLHLVLTMKARHGKLDRSSATDLLLLLFSKQVDMKMYLNDLSIIQLRDHVVFDFSGMVIRNSFFQQYDHFWDCTFDDDTLFHDCSFSSLFKREGLKTNLKAANFTSTCTWDAMFEEELQASSEDENISSKKISDNIAFFLKIFITDGYFKPQKDIVVRSKYKKGNYNKIFNALSECEIIQEYINLKKPMGKQWEINKKHSIDIEKFVYQGLMSHIIKMAIHKAMKD
ncbi:MAG: hypothetical protein H7839_08180 [Magnetococcus sp. YQC-5]